MTEIVKGSILRDNDPRHGGRTVTVTKVTKNYAHYKAGVRTAKVRLDRIFIDGQNRKIGYDLVFTGEAFPAAVPASLIY